MSYLMEFVEAFDNLCDNEKPQRVISCLIELVSADNYWLKANISKDDLETLKRTVKELEGGKDA